MNQSPKELRISITQNCNYRCIFCHNDGIDPNIDAGKKNIDELLKIIDRFIKEGYLDITLTGGEPLLFKEDIYKIIESVGASRYTNQPEITIVTNGALIDEEFIEKIRNYKNLKLNVSVHSYDNTTYRELTRPRGYSKSVDEIINNIKMLTSNGIKTKINYVVLKSKNNYVEQINKAIRTSIEIGARAIKFIELLVPDDKEGLIHSYYEVKSISQMLKDNISLVKDDGRKAEYRLINGPPDFQIELVKCSCKIGCNGCLKYRPIMIDSYLKYYPCFMDTDPITVNSSNCISKLDEGKEVIKSMANKYGKLAPILNNEPTFEEMRYEIYYIMHKDTFDYFLSNYRNEGIMRSRHVNAVYYVYIPRTADIRWKNYEITVRIRLNKYNEEESGIVQSINEYKIDNELDAMVAKVFFAKEDNFLITGQLNETTTILKKLDFIKVYEYEIEGFYYRGKRGTKFSILNIRRGNKSEYVASFFPRNESDKNEIKMLSEKYNLMPIKESLFSWIEKLQNPEYNSTETK